MEKPMTSLTVNGKTHRFDGDPEMPAVMKAALLPVYAEMFKTSASSFPGASPWWREYAK
jgi:hypothetical protein